MNISSSVTFFLKAGARFSLKVATKVSFRGKEKLWQSRFLLDYFSKTKTEEFNQKIWSVYNILGITIRRSAQYYPEVSSHVPEKVATKSSFKGKNTQKNLDFKSTFLKQKGRNATENIEMSLIILASLCPVKLYIFEK